MPSVPLFVPSVPFFVPSVTEALACCSYARLNSNVLLNDRCFRRSPVRCSPEATAKRRQKIRTSSCGRSNTAGELLIQSHSEMSHLFVRNTTGRTSRRTNFRCDHISSTSDHIPSTCPKMFHTIPASTCFRNFITLDFSVQSVRYFIFKRRLCGRHDRCVD